MHHIDEQVHFYDTRRAKLGSAPVLKFGYRVPLREGANSTRKKQKTRYARGSAKNSFFARGYPDGTVMLWDVRAGAKKVSVYSNHSNAHHHATLPFRTSERPPHLLPLATCRPEDRVPCCPYARCGALRAAGNGAVVGRTSPGGASAPCTSIGITLPAARPHSHPSAPAPFRSHSRLAFSYPSEGPSSSLPSRNGRLLANPLPSPRPPPPHLPPP